MPKLAANLTMMFNELDFLDRFEAAAKAGFTGVEYLFPYAFSTQDMAARLNDNGLTLVLHNMPAGDWGAGERGIACHPDRIAEFKAGVEQTITYATALNCPRVHCLAGIAPQGVGLDLVHATYVENLKYAAEKLNAAGIKLLIEAINTRDVVGYYLNRTRQALDIIAEIGSDNIALQYDIYHMQIMEGDLAPTLQKHLGLIEHIQVADTPGRHEPGSGEINYPFLFDFLDKIGYDGWIGCEYTPATTTQDGLGWADAYLKG